jgi:uncharacterized protein
MTIPSGRGRALVVALAAVVPLVAQTQPPADQYAREHYTKYEHQIPMRDGKRLYSFEKPEPFVAGQPATIRFEMPDAFHTFRRGHRIMVQIQSSWFPFIDRNPQKFMDIPKATEANFLKATHRVYRSKSLPSALTLQTLGSPEP